MTVLRRTTFRQSFLALTWCWAAAVAARPSAAPKAGVSAAAGAHGAESNALQVRISIARNVVIEPQPLGVALELQNSGPQTLWLYRPVRPFNPASDLGRHGRELDQPGSGLTSGGSSLEVNLRPAGANPRQARSSREGRSAALSRIGIPHPGLIRLKAGASVKENVLLHLAPAQTESHGKAQPIWGAYELSVTYRAGYSNAAEIERDAGVKLWQGKARSNEVSLTLASGGGQGSIEGTVVNSISQPLSNALVTLTTANEDPLEQTWTHDDGRFAFRNLPWGLYWAFAREPGRRTENLVYRHGVLSGESPTSDLTLMLISERAYDAKRLLHKAVLFRVVGASGQPLEGVKVEALFANGRVVEKVQGQTAADGTAALELISGRNFVNLKKRGCRDEERRADVSYGSGVSAFEFDLDCNKK